MLSYEEIDICLKEHSADVDAAECHGILCGQLSANTLFPDRSDSLSIWLKQILPNFIGVDSASNGVNNSGGDCDNLNVFVKLYDETLNQLENPENSLALLLPDENLELDYLIESIALWCHGYLAGLSLAGITNFNRLPGDCAEICQDIAEIAKSTQYRVEPDDEIIFVELVEFVRVAAMLVNEEFCSIKKQFPKGPLLSPMH